MARKKRGHTAVVTTSPDTPAPTLRCPDCDTVLTYKKTVLGGVQPPERWDAFVCHPCSLAFEYRSRTRRLRLVA